jgi:hypothetical protein
LTPGWSAYPSGHATEAFMFANIFQSLCNLNDKSDIVIELQRFARVVSDNRVYAGVHYPVDGVAGRKLAAALSGYFVSRCVGQAWKHHTMLGQHSAVLNNASVDLTVAIDEGAPYYKAASGNQSCPAADSVMAHIWAEARKEMKDLGYLS